jgi:hypothetical protein
VDADIHVDRAVSIGFRYEHEGMAPEKLGAKKCATTADDRIHFFNFDGEILGQPRVLTNFPVFSDFRRLWSGCFAYFGRNFGGDSLWIVIGTCAIDPRSLDSRHFLLVN